MGSNKIAGVAEPISAQDVATKNYVDVLEVCRDNWHVTYINVIDAVMFILPTNKTIVYNKI